VPPVAYLPISAHSIASAQTAAFLKRRSTDFDGGGGVSGFRSIEIRLGPERSWSTVYTVTATAHTTRIAPPTRT
jgi:hypothetical protein